MLAFPPRTSTFVIVALPLMTFAACDFAPAPNSTKAVFLRSGPLTPPSAGTEASTVQPWARRVVRFDRTPDTHTARRIVALGGRVDAVLPGNGYLVSMPSHAVDSLQTLADVGWVAPYPATAKIAPEVAALASGSLRTTEDVTLIVELFADADPSQVSQHLGALGLEVTAQRRRTRFGRVVVRAAASAIAATQDRIAAHPGVFWIGHRAPRVLLNDTSAWVGQSGLDGNEATPLFDHGINGAGQIGAVLDSGLDVDHCMFWDEDLGLPPVNQGFDTEVDPQQRKVIAYDMLHDEDDPAQNGDWDGHGHGTHVAGSIAGDQGSNGTHEEVDGMAPGAKLVVQDGGGGQNYTDDCSDMPALGCPVADLQPIFQQAYDQGARVHNNSWGDRENFADADTYSDGCQDADEFMWENPDFLLVFAAGNSGPSAGTVASPSVAKSPLSVGATARGTGAAGLASFSSRGPAADGRLKPDITFPGASIQSASNDGDVTTQNCSPRGMSGTSMASPGAAGMVLLARQFYADGFYPSGVATTADGFSPSAALLKATMVNSGVHMTEESVIPSMDQGWGRIQLGTVLAFDDSDFSLYVDDSSTGLESPDDGPVTYEIEVASANAPLKATLVWTDFPSTPAADTNLVNDLDLVLDGPAGTFLGNVYDGGESATGGTADRLNNVEQVWLSAPMAGSYTLQVIPHAIPMGPQRYALVVTGDITVVPPDGDDDGGTDGGDTGGDSGTGDDTDTGDESGDSDDTGGTGDTGSGDGSDDPTDDGSATDTDDSSDSDDDSDGPTDDTGDDDGPSGTADDGSGTTDPGDGSDGSDGTDTHGEDTDDDDDAGADDSGQDGAGSCRVGRSSGHDAWWVALMAGPVLLRRRRPR